ncbi:SDR family oxidoreductase [Mucilaginibacter daejeonensis]|uniref:SDR family oxidoreductase n=1 Tax=Mucilaginibacter daejeonensis TaxID=398049 RepID=UPI001D1763BA|nr:SDR family oxidoreductase [Mucilaginibacter daejeonensis]UEG51694.1 SDR family oxidoreductase [Mucilaginibacter daejeonensis]
MSMSNDQVYAPVSVVGKTIIVTGGTTGIGRATALLLASEGANVLIAGSDQAHLDDVLKDVAGMELAGSLNGIATDLSTEQGIIELFKAIDELSGGIDVFINNAALAYQGISDGEYTEWQRVVNTNLLGYLACTHYALDRMRPQKNGHIVNIGSMSADVREKDSSVYVATKAAIQGFSESLRKEVNEQGIRVTLIEPGAVGTDMQPVSVPDQQKQEQQHAMMLAEDIARTVLFAVTLPERAEVVELKIKPRLQII